MTDNTTTADKVQEVIDFLTEHAKAEKTGDYEIGYANAIQNCLSLLDGIVPTPPTLADELRAFEGRGHWDSELLDSFADRVETLEQERDELAYAREEGKAAADNWQNTARRLDEAHAEITRLRAREIPEGWRIADHPHYGRVITREIASRRGRVEVRYIDKDGRSRVSEVSADSLSFRDEAPAPEPEGDYITGGLADSKPEGLDPASCGRYRPYLVEVNGEEERVMIRHDDDSEPWVDVSDVSFWKDDELTVIRPLTSEEMDAR